MAVSESHGHIVVLSMRLSVLTVWNCPPPRCVATALAMEGFSATHSTFVTTMLSMNTLRLRAPPFHVRLWDGVDEDVAESKQKLGTRRGRRAPSGSTHVCLRQIHSRKFRTSTNVPPTAKAKLGVEAFRGTGSTHFSLHYMY